MTCLRRLWREESGLVQSAEIVLITTIVVIGMIVGLATYRDGVVEELADIGRAVGALNQSYSVAIAASPTAGITVAGNVVTITKNFGDTDPGAGVTPRVIVVASFNNYSFTDTPDFGAAGTITRSAPAATEANPASAPVP